MGSTVDEYVIAAKRFYPASDFAFMEFISDLEIKLAKLTKFPFL